MHYSPSRRRRAAGSILVLIGLLAAAGCQEDEITHAIVPRTAEPEKTRLLGVIYPHGDQTWFFKLMGPESSFEGVVEPFNDFMKSVRFTDKPDSPLTWTLPDGWQQGEGSKMVYAEFRVGDKPLKFTVSKLAKKQENEVLDNVNRWRGQLGLEPVDQAGLAALKNGGLVTFPQGADGPCQVDLIGPGTGHATAKGPAWTYEKPDGWVETPELVIKGVRREAVFKITEGEQTAEVSVTAFGGSGGDLESNVQRWAQQIDAPPVNPDDLKKIPRITIADREAPYVDLTGKTQRTVGAIVAVGDKTWFFKLTGPPEVVEKQKSKFEEFLKSVKFDGGMGGEQ